MQIVTMGMITGALMLGAITVFPAAAASFAGVANGIWSTGFNNASGLLAGGAVDPHYVLISLPAGCSGLPCNEDGTPGNSFGPSVYVVLGPNGTFPLNGTWSPNTSTAQWIGTRADQTNPLVGGTVFPNVSVFASATDPYVYRQVFNISALGLDPATARIDLSWQSDDATAGTAGTTSHTRLCPIASSSDPVCPVGATITNSGNPGPLSLGNVVIAHAVNNANFAGGLMAIDFVVFNAVAASGLNPSGFRVQVNSATAEPLRPSFRSVINGVWSTGFNSANGLLAGGAVDPHYVLISLPAGCSGLPCNEDGTPGNSFGPSVYVVLGPNGTFPLNGTWSPNTSTAQWIGTRADQTNPLVGGTVFPNVSVFASATDPYVYRQVFNISALGLDPTTALIRLQWQSDSPTAGGGAFASHIRLCAIASASDPSCSPTRQVVNSNSQGEGTVLGRFVDIVHGIGNAQFSNGLMALDFMVFNDVSAATRNPAGMRVRIVSATALPPPLFANGFESP